MATYNNQYAMNIKPATPNLRGMSDTYDNTGTNKVSNMGLGELYELDYDRNKIEQVFNQGTDAQYALMQKENQIAENQYANQTFANQQSAIEALRQQRNSQIASGMARGLNAAQEQGTILGLQQEAQAGALELANARQLEADKIAAEYANNVVKALQEANSVKQAMAQVGAQLYEADMLGYTGELSAGAQMDANASDRYGYDLGLEGTQYTANKNLEGTKYNADKNYEGTRYAADRNYEGTIGAANIQAAATRAAATTSAEAQKAAAALAAQGVNYDNILAGVTNANGTINTDRLVGQLVGNGVDGTQIDKIVTQINNTQNPLAANYDTWRKAVDGNNNALKELGIFDQGFNKGKYNNSSVKGRLNEVQKQITNGTYSYTNNTELMNYIIYGTNNPDSNSTKLLNKGW